MVISQRLLTRKRLAYPWIIGAVLWLAWLLNVAAGSGKMDLAGHVVGTDYLEFYTAGYTLRVGDSARLYDLAYQSNLQQQIIGPALRDYYAFITPPFLAWLFVPFSALSYLPSFALWSLFSLAALCASLRLLDARSWHRALGWSITWFPIWATVSYGQNSLLSLFLLSLTYWFWRRRWLWCAGLACAMLMYKPQLVTGIALLWLLDWRRDTKALLGLGLGSVGLVIVTVSALPAASTTYLAFAGGVLPGLPGWLQFPLWNLHSLRGFWRLLLPRQQVLADSLYVAASLVAITGFVTFWRRYRERPNLLFAGALCLTIAVTPHAMIYDWALLLIPAVLLWEELPMLRPQLTPLYAAIWLATLISGPLAYAQLRILPMAFQVSVPVLFAVLYYAWRALFDPAGPSMTKAETPG